MARTTADSTKGLDPRATTELVDEIWDKEIVPAITEYIQIPNKSPAFDPGLEGATGTWTGRWS